MQFSSIGITYYETTNGRSVILWSDLSLIVLFPTTTKRGLQISLYEQFIDLSFSLCWRTKVSKVEFFDEDKINVDKTITKRSGEPFAARETSAAATSCDASSGITSAGRRGRHLDRSLHLDIELPETAIRTGLISVLDPFRIPTARLIFRLFHTRYRQLYTSYF